MIHRPKYLTGDSRAFWDRHAKRLYDAGVLTDADVESFVMLCDVWGLLRRCRPEEDSKEAIRFIGLSKQLQGYLKQFGLMPLSRKQTKMETAPQEVDTFGL